MITVWGRATSGNVQIVMWAIGELGLEHERIDVGGSFGGLDAPDFAAKNPNRLIPVIKDGDGPYLWESAAIVRYLGARYGHGSFWPSNPARRAQLDMWAEWAKTTFNPSLLTGLFLPLVFTAPAKQDRAAIEAAATKIGALAAILDRRLAEGPYLGGEALCFADIVVGTLLYRYFTLDFARGDTPNLLAYYERLTQRPAYARHAMVSYEHLRVK